MIALAVSSTGFVTESGQLLAGFSVTHYETQWQLATSSSFGPESILDDTWFQTTRLTQYTANLEPGVYYVRARYRDNYGIISEWSVALEVILGPAVESEEVLPFELDLIPELRLGPLQDIPDLRRANEDTLERVNLVIKTFNRLLTHLSEEHGLLEITDLLEHGD